MAEPVVRDQVRQHFFETLAEIQRNAGREVPTITDETVPFDHLPGFDSVSGVEAEVTLSGRLGVEIDKIAFVLPRTGKHATVREIVDTIAEKYGARLSGKANTPHGATTAASQRTSVA